MTVLVFAPDSNLIDKQIRDLYLQGVPVKEISKNAEIGVGYGTVKKRVIRMRRRGLLPYRSEPKRIEIDTLHFSCPQCRSACDSRIEAELCCAAEEEVWDVLRRCGL